LELRVVSTVKLTERIAAFSRAARQGSRNRKME
jgi:hypothetical protein